MAAVQTRKNKVGNFLKKELWPEEFFCREQGTVTYAGLGAEEAGEIVYKANAAATEWIAVPAAVDPATALIGVIVDSEIDDKIDADKALQTPTGDVTGVAILTKGPAVLRKA